MAKVFSNFTDPLILIFRVTKAFSMLEDGDFSFDEITYRAGYEDPSSFRKIFSKLTGRRLTEYRKKFSRI